MNISRVDSRVDSDDEVEDPDSIWRDTVTPTPLEEAILESSSQKSDDYLEHKLEQSEPTSHKQASLLPISDKSATALIDNSTPNQSNFSPHKIDLITSESSSNNIKHNEQNTEVSCNWHETDATSTNCQVSPKRKRVDSQVNSNSKEEVDGEAQTTPKKYKMSAVEPPTQLLSTPHYTVPSSFHPIDTGIKKIQAAKIRVWEDYFLSSGGKQPCPGCGHLMDCDVNFDFEIQNIVQTSHCLSEHFPWNNFVLCSFIPEYVDDCSNSPDCESNHGTNAASARGWGCSELRDRLLELTDDVDSDSADVSSSNNAIDWMVVNYPKRVHEFLIRMQRAHGDKFGHPAGDTSSLRFAEFVYRMNKPVSVLGGDESLKWMEMGHGYKCNILDLNDCLRHKTDIEVLEIIERKQLITPKRRTVPRPVRTPMNHADTPSSIVKLVPKVMPNKTGGLHCSPTEIVGSKSLKLISGSYGQKELFLPYEQNENCKDTILQNSSESTLV